MSHSSKPLRKESSGPWLTSWASFSKSVPYSGDDKLLFFFLVITFNGVSSGHVWMWELDCKENWTPKNWCFWAVVLERLLRVPWTARRSSQSILKEISPGCSLEGLMLKLKLQYSGHLMRRVDPLEKTLMLGGIGGRRRRGRQRMRCLDGIANLMGMGLEDSGSWWWIGRPGVLQSMGSRRVWYNWATELKINKLKKNDLLLK